MVEEEGLAGSHGPGHGEHTGGQIGHLRVAEDIPGDVPHDNLYHLINISLLSRLQKTSMDMLLIKILIDHFKANNILVVKVGHP